MQFIETIRLMSYFYIAVFGKAIPKADITVLNKLQISMICQILI